MLAAQKTGQPYLGHALGSRDRGSSTAGHGVVELRRVRHRRRQRENAGARHDKIGHFPAAGQARPVPHVDITTIKQIFIPCT